jgi:hypothetical protein
MDDQRDLLKAGLCAFVSLNDCRCILGGRLRAAGREREKND